MQIKYNKEEAEAIDWLLNMPYHDEYSTEAYHKSLKVTDDGTGIATNGDCLRVKQGAFCCEDVGVYRCSYNMRSETWTLAPVKESSLFRWPDISKMIKLVEDTELTDKLYCKGLMLRELYCGGLLPNASTISRMEEAWYNVSVDDHLALMYQSPLNGAPGGFIVLTDDIKLIHEVVK